MRTRWYHYRPRHYGLRGTPRDDTIEGAPIEPPSSPPTTSIEQGAEGSQIVTPADQGDFGGGGTDFQKSDLSQPSSDSESWRSMSDEMKPSEGSGSGNIEQGSTHNDAQWLRRFSLIVYGGGDYGGGGDANPAPSDGGGNGDFGGGGDSRRRVIPFRRPGTRDDTIEGSPIVGSTPSSSTSSSTPTQESGIDLSALRCTFSVTKSTNSSPNMLFAKVYNLAPATVGKVIEFTRVQVSAGYKYANYGMIFDGQVIQYRRGKDTPVDTYLEIHAGDGNTINDAVHIGSYEKGAKKEDLLNNLNEERKKLDATFKEQSVDTSALQDKYQRQRICFGHIRNLERQLAQEGGYHSWTDNNQYVYMKKTAYLDDEAVVLTPRTGLIGLPEVTPQGIQLRCLLNPRIKLGGIVQIDNAVLSGVAYTPGTGVEVDKNGNVIGPGNPTGGVVQDPELLGAGMGQFFETAYTSLQGRYKVCLMTISGDTRGNEWFCDMICVALDSQGNAMVGSNQSNAFLRMRPEDQGSSQAVSPPGDTRRLTYVRR